MCSIAVRGCYPRIALPPPPPKGVLDLVNYFSTSTGGVELIVSLLAHDNSDIVLSVVELLNELTGTKPCHYKLRLCKHFNIFYLFSSPWKVFVQNLMLNLLWDNLMLNLRY